MVVVSILPYADFERIDHRDDALHFTKIIFRMTKSKKSRKIREINVNGVRINSEFTPADIHWDIDKYCYPVSGSEGSVTSANKKSKKKKNHESSAKSSRKVIFRK